MKPDAAPPAPPPSRSLLWTVGLVAAAALLIWGALALQERETAADRRSTAQAELQAVIDGVIAEFSAGLPKPFAPGLVLEKVAFEGRSLVMTLRSEKLDALAVQADPAVLAEVRNAEMADMRLLCDNPDMLYLLVRDVTVTRRFLDANGNPFFEITLAAQSCRRTP